MKGRRFTHLNEAGHPQMVDVSAKPETERVAVASGAVFMSPEALQVLQKEALPKGDALTVAEIAGILAAKRTDEWIPLAHPLPLSYINVSCKVLSDRVEITAEVKTSAKTGVEMEALTAVTAAALTLYDMCKAVDRGMVIGDIRLLKKTGGVHGDWEREKSAG